MRLAKSNVALLRKAISVAALPRSWRDYFAKRIEKLARVYWGRERRSAETSVPEGFTMTGAYTQTEARRARA